MSKLYKYYALWLVGGIIYYIIELIGRGHSHWSMFILGGLCFIALGLINEVISWHMPLTLQMLIGAGIITVLELITGLIVNKWLGLGVWDYSKLPFNLWGQICLHFTVIWYFLSVVGIVLDDYLRYWFCGEDKPHYTIWRWGK